LIPKNRCENFSSGFLHSYISDLLLKSLAEIEVWCVYGARYLCLNVYETLTFHRQKHKVKHLHWIK